MLANDATPFDLQTAVQKVQAAEDARNTCDPVTVALAYTADSVWRNRDQFVTGRAEIAEFLYKKWEREQDYSLRKELWGFRKNRAPMKQPCHGTNGRNQRCGVSHVDGESAIAPQSFVRIRHGS